MIRSVSAFVAAFVIAYVMPVHAQTPYLGVIGGVHFADLNLEFVDKSITNYDVQSRTLFGAGGIIGISVNEYLSLQLEPMYLQKGGIYTRPPTPDMRIGSNHIELPLLVKAGIGDKVRPYIMGGVSMSFVLNASIEVELAGRTWEGDLAQILKGSEFGALFGAGISLQVWKSVIFLEGRYALGLTNLNKGGSLNLTSGGLVLSGPQTDPQDEIKTKGIQIMVGFQYPLGVE